MSLKVLIPLSITGGLLFVGILFLSPRLAITIVLLALGFSMVWKTSWWIEMFGRNPWAEEHMGGVGSLAAGAGGSWLFYKLLGIVVMIGAFLYLTGGLQSILVGTLGSFFSSGVYD